MTSPLPLPGAACACGKTFFCVGAPSSAPVATAALRPPTLNARNRPRTRVLAESRLVDGLIPILLLGGRIGAPRGYVHRLCIGPTQNELPKTTRHKQRQIPSPSLAVSALQVVVSAGAEHMRRPLRRAEHRRGTAEEHLGRIRPVNVPGFDSGGDPP